jgi:tetratricopeptide (TPR) repeat protein
VTRPRIRRNLASLLSFSVLVWVLVAGGPTGASNGPDEASDGPSASTEAAEADTCRATPAALLVQGVRAFERQDMRAGLELLARVVDERPRWEPALAVEAGALLRSGRFAEAAERYRSLLGEDRANALSDGSLTARDLRTAVDPELVLGLATATHQLGNHRAADRLYRAYADLVGPTSPRAARAYWRLSEMFSEADVSWGDAAAERAKALAVDPTIAAKATLPDHPDLRSIPETEPYTREIALAPDREGPAGPVESLPVLVRWSEPAFPDGGVTAERRAEEIEILVGERGHPEELALPSELDLGTEPGASLAEAVMEWCFEPAEGESGAVAAWIVFGVDVPAAADTLQAEGSAESRADTSRPRTDRRRGASRCARFSITRTATTSTSARTSSP